MAGRVLIYRTPDELARAAAEVVVGQIEQKPASVLALPTGQTPLLMYQELVRRQQAGQVSFAGATVFALDEYYDLPPGHPRSFRTYLEQHFVRPSDLDPARLHVPRSDAASPQAEAEAFERAIAAAGGIDLAVLGIGSNGHIGFNEPGSSFESRTRLVALAPDTFADQAVAFADEPFAPSRAITMGIATILSARRIVLVATGARKGWPVRDALLDLLTPDLPASALRRHGNCLFLLDEEAARLLDAGRPTTDDRRPTDDGGRKAKGERRRAKEDHTHVEDPSSIGDRSSVVRRPSSVVRRRP